MTRHWADVVKDALRDLKLEELLQVPALVQTKIDEHMEQKRRDVTRAQGDLERAQQKLDEAQKLVKT